MKSADTEIKGWHIAAAAVLAFTGAVITYKLVNRQTFVDKLIVFIKQWEGGLSRAKTDTASTYPAPWKFNGLYGWHTNKGITYSTFVALSKELGYAVTPRNFFMMPNKLWLAILFHGYMKPYPLHHIKHLPRIQAVIITWAWGSGLQGSEFRLARFQREVMGVVDSNITKAEIVENFKRYVNKVNERKWFNLLCDRRAQDFRRMSTFAKNGRGWLRRLAHFRTTFG